MKIHNPAIDPLEYKDFLEVMNNMNEVFPNITHKARLKYYFDAVKDLPLKATRDIAKKFLMGSKTMPLPNDFKDAAREWRKANEVFVFDDSPAPIDCNKCGDLGILRLHKHGSADYDTLINCNCTVSVFKTLKAPPWKIDLAAGYSYSKCPVEWFKPDDLPEGEIDITAPQIHQKIAEWEVRKNKAETYWNGLGYEHK